MRKILAALIMLLSCLNAYETSARQEQDSTKSSAAQEIRAALCEIDKRDYAAAQLRVEKILESDPQNIYAQRLRPGLIARQIKRADKSPENIALIRKTIEAYERAIASLHVSAEEQRKVENHVLSLYGMIGKEERTNELLKRASDSHRPPKYRSELYAVLAEDSYYCASDVTTKMETPQKSEIARAKECVRKGLEFAGQAIALDANNSEGWSYKGQLLNQASVLAGIENDRARKALYRKQSDAAGKRAEVLFAKLREEDLKRQEELRPKQSDDKENLKKELTEYSAENSLAGLVKEIYIDDVSALVAPVPPYVEKEREASRQEQEKRVKERRAKFQEKHNWKSFSPANEEIIADLPDNVIPEEVGGDARSYEASSEDLKYAIFSQPRTATHANSSMDDGALNALAWAYVNTLNRFFLNGSTANAFTVKLLRKETVSGQPGRVYAYATTSCSEQADGTLVFYVGKRRYYTLLIEGAKESDQRVQRFLKSIKFK